MKWPRKLSAWPHTSYRSRHASCGEWIRNKAMAKKENEIVAKELRGRAEGELNSLLAAKIEELTKTKFKLSLGQLRTTHQIGALKRDVAVLKTVLNERKQEAGSAA